MKFIKQNWLYALLALLPFERIPSWDITVLGKAITLRLSIVVAGLAVLYYLPQIAKKYRFGLSKPTSWMLLYLFIAGLSVLASTEPKRGLIALIATIVTVLTGIVVATTLRQFNDHKIYRVLFLTTMAVCLIGIYQFVGDSLGLPTALTGLRDIYTYAVFGFPRIQSTALEPLYLGSFLLIPLMLIVGRIYTGQAAKKEYLGLYILGLTIVLTLSRGAFGSAVAGLGVVGILFLKRTSWKRILLLIGIAVLGIGTAFGMITASENLAGANAPSDNKPAVQAFVDQSTHTSTNPGRPDGDRGVTRYLAKQGFTQQPIIGHGLGSFGSYAARQDKSFTEDTIVNNQYLETLYETGAAGAIALVGFLAALAYQWLKAWEATDKYRLWLGCLGATVIAFLVQYYSFSTLYVLHIWVTLGLLLGFISLSLAKKDTKETAIV